MEKQNTFLYGITYCFLMMFFTLIKVKMAEDQNKDMQPCCLFALCGFENEDKLIKGKKRKL